MYKDYLKFDYKKEEKEIVNFLMNHIKRFNPSLYETIVNKYPIVLENANQLTEEQFADIIENIGYYIVKTNNNKVAGSTIIEDEEIEKKIEQTKKDNEQAANVLFPKRRKLYADGSEEIYANGENKFAEEEAKTR